MQRNDFVRQANVIASEIILPADTKPVWHWHSSIEETVYCLHGIVNVRVDQQTDQQLGPGQKVTIAAGVMHAIDTQSLESASYLLIQQGAYDFNHCEAPQ